MWRNRKDTELRRQMRKLETMRLVQLWMKNREEERLAELKRVGAGKIDVGKV